MYSNTHNPIDKINITYVIESLSIKISKVTVNIPGNINHFGPLRKKNSPVNNTHNHTKNIHNHAQNSTGNVSMYDPYSPKWFGKASAITERINKSMPNCNANCMHECPSILVCSKIKERKFSKKITRVNSNTYISRAQPYSLKKPVR